MDQTTYYVNVYGVELPYKGPAKVEDIETLAGDPGCCQRAFMRADDYSGRMPEIRGRLSKALEELSGVKRLTKDNGNQVNDKDESDKDFLDRLEGSKAITEDQKLQLLHKINEELGDKTSFDSTSQRKPAAKYYEMADGALAKIAAGATAPDGETCTNERTISKIQARLKVDFASAFGEFNRDNLARAYKAVEERAQRELAASL